MRMKTENIPSKVEKEVFYFLKLKFASKLIIFAQLQIQANPFKFRIYFGNESGKMIKWVSNNERWVQLNWKTSFQATPCICFLIENCQFLTTTLVDWTLKK